jgi:hypothetical protein
MSWFKNLQRRVFGSTPIYDGTGGGRRALAWMPSNPGAVSALAFAQDELRAKSRDLVRRNAWAASGIEAFVANAIGTGIKPQSMVAAAAGAALPTGASDLMGTMVNLAHTGGLLGVDALKSRSASAAIFEGAPRFHTGGLVSGEVPIIAREGEAVFTPGQMRALGGSLNAKSSVQVQVNVINRAQGVDARVEQQRQPDGSLQLDVIVEQIEGRMARSISRGTGLAPTLDRRYGLNPAAGSLR